jgi:hypothetical protein
MTHRFGASKSVDIHRVVLNSLIPGGPLPHSGESARKSRLDREYTLLEGVSLNAVEVMAAEGEY